MTTLDLGVIGNCTIGALIDPKARIVWACLPRFDGDPVFSSLVDGPRPERGFFDVEVLGATSWTRSYLKNTAILSTRIADDAGNELEIVDFAPRFVQHGRVFRPATIVRMLRPVSGTPRIRVRLRPHFQHGATEGTIARGTNHCRFIGPEQTVRLTTDLSVSYILTETPFLLDAPAAMILGPDESLSDGVSVLARSWFEDTRFYWEEWSRGLTIPFEWQAAVIRAAITLKLSNFEETGGIIAALTTSVPEFGHSKRNWDYRFCWLRDAFFVVLALNRLSATRTMEHHQRYLANIAASAPDGLLQPVYGIALETDLVEWEAEHLAGYRGMGPVRIGNAAYTQPQHDVYGAAVLACTQSFFDERLTTPGTVALFERLERLGAHAVRLYDQPDAGLWELRNSRHVHTFSAVMCWAAADRLARIATRLELADRAAFWRDHADRMHARIVEASFNAEINAFAATFGGADMDASLLLLHELGFVAATDPRFVGTVEAIERTLVHGGLVYRYVIPDDFGTPETAFTVCTFWYIDALAAIGRRDDARAMFERMLTLRNPLGLMSEDVETTTGELWGNFPQTYSHVGLINSATRLSIPWQEGF